VHCCQHARISAIRFPQQRRDIIARLQTMCTYHTAGWSAGGVLGAVLYELIFRMTRKTVRRYPVPVVGSNAIEDARMAPRVSAVGIGQI
jgi:hypothetical protein